MIQWFELDQSQHTDLLNGFINFLQTFQTNGFLQSEVNEVMPSIPWKFYKSALDVGSAGLLQFNMQTLVMDIDKSSKARGIELDLIAFVPTYNRALGIPR